MGVKCSDKVVHWVNTHTSDDYCSYCIHRKSCKRFVVYNTMSEPIVPNCYTCPIVDLLDKDMLLHDLM